MRAKRVQRITARAAIPVALLLATVWLACGFESAPTESQPESSAPAASAESTPPAAEPPADGAPFREDPALQPPTGFAAKDEPNDTGTKLRLLWEPSPDDKAPKQVREDELKRDRELRWHATKAQREQIEADRQTVAASQKAGYVIRRKPHGAGDFAWSVPLVESPRFGEGQIPDAGLTAPITGIPAGTREYVDDDFAYLEPVGEDAELKADDPAEFSEVKALRAQRQKKDPKKTSFDYELRYFEGDRMSPPVLLTDVRPHGNLYNTHWNNVLLVVLVAGGLILGNILRARRGKALYVRPIAGLQAVDDAVGRATEMGRPVLFCAGFDGVSSISTIAAMVLLGRIARVAAEHGTDLIVPCKDPVVMTALREVVKEAYLAAGKPEDYREDRIYFLTDAQFAYAAGMSGIMVREKTATNFYFGYYYAESLILTEAGFMAGSIQIVGTDSFTQLPFFVTTCDFTLMGEEFYGASAYLSREPKLLGSLKGQDYSKLLIAASMVVALVAATLCTTFELPGVAEWIKELFHYQIGG